MVSSKTDLHYSSWLVFLDGVQVPHQGFSLDTSVDGVSHANIILEPDFQLTEMRPQTVVHIFMRDNNPLDDIVYEDEQDEMQNRYYLYWEGLLKGYQHTKQPEARAFIIECEGLMGVLTRTRGFMMGLGALSYSPILSGSSTVNADTIAGQAVWSLIALAESATSMAEQGENIPFRDSVKPKFSDVLIRIISHLASHNAALRQQIVRYRLLDKICGLQDQSLVNFLKVATVMQQQRNPEVHLSEQSSVMEMLEHLLSYGFYHHVDCFLPNRPEQPDRKFHPQLSSVKGAAEQYRLPQIALRNDTILLPETYYYLPPPCNFVFPDNLLTLTVSRNFYSEPTRRLVPDPAITATKNTASYYLSPPDILRSLSPKERSALNGSELFAAALSYASLDALTLSGTPSPYATPANINLLSILSDSEIEKGLVVEVGQPNFESFAAWAKSLEAGAAADQIAVYQQFMTEVSDFQYQMARFNRTAQVQVTGHRYLVAGFPLVVFDTDIVYLGYVTSSSINVDSSGAEITTVALQHVRPIPRVSLSKLQAFVVELRVLIGEARVKEKELNNAAGSYNSQEEANTARAKNRFDAHQEFNSSAQSFSREFDIPIPPLFFSENMVSLEAVDDLYESLLGCKRFYTSEYAKDLRIERRVKEIKKTGESLDLADVLTQRLEAFVSLTQGYRALHEVFNFQDVSGLTDGQSRSGSSSVKSWQDVTAEDSLSAGPLAWEINTFLRRNGTSVGQFMTDNQLTLNNHTSTRPSPTTFWSFLPASTNFVETSTWDNSIFSKLVDEQELSGLGTDDFITTARDQVDTHGLRTSERQAIIFDYSRRHFGGRAFGGN